ncbi:hypothetical protein [uncultured Enorma sp.]|uniref:hypothetical protein n=1 Tax=uncultured Enorma sp. TaxID=1714346 RepID=UPI00259452CB|nr:hypothetical protein [uncultured Enorma sp.]
MKELDKVTLSDGRTGYILEVFNDGEAYLIEFETPEGSDRYDDAVFEAKDVRPAEAE